MADTQLIDEFVAARVYAEHVAIVTVLGPANSRQSIRTASSASCSFDSKDRVR
jgi:hypothetical protein